MRRLADIDLLGDGGIQRHMAQWSLVVLVGGLLLGILAIVAFPHEQIGPLWFLVLLLVSILVLPIHELIHACAFGLFSGFSSHIRFGIANFMLYTTAEGLMLTRHRFCAVLLAPATIITVATLGICAAMGLPVLGWFAAVIHLAGCTGDFALAHIIMRDHFTTHVEDTSYGVALFHDE